MLSLEQVKLLDKKVARAVEYVQQANEENKALRARLEANQKRIDELEVVVKHFKEDQGRIEDGILSALDRLSQFESAIEKSLAGAGESASAAAGASTTPAEKPRAPAAKTVSSKPAADRATSSPATPAPEKTDGTSPSAKDIPDPLSAGTDAENGELDIF